MKFIDNNKNMTILLAVLLIIFGAVAVITYPKGEVDINGEYQQVSVSVVDMEKKGWTSRYNRSTYYELTVKYNNKYYKLTVSTAPFTVGASYNMYLYNGRIYSSVREIERSVVDSQTSLVCRISMWIAFISTIFFIGYLTAFIQERHKKIR